MKKLKSWFVRVPLFLATAGVSARLFFLSVAHAQTATPPPNVSDTSDLTNLICNFISYFFWIVLIISVIMVLVAAYDYVTAGDDAEKTTRGRKRLTYAAVGIAVALIATGFPAIVSSVFPQSPNANLSDAGCSF